MLKDSIRRLKEAAKPSNYTSQVSLITVSSHDLNLLLLEYEKLEHTKQLNTEIQNQDRFGVAS